MVHVATRKATTISYLDHLAKDHAISVTKPSPDNIGVATTDDTKRKILAGRVSMSTMPVEY